MNRMSAVRARSAGRAAWLCFIAGLALTGTGCTALVIGAAGGAAGAVYIMGKLQEEVSYDVRTVHEAVVAGLKDLELKVLEDRSDKLSAHLESRFADGTKVWVGLEALEPSRTKITIRVGLTGDEVRSRRILEAIKRHLPSAVS